MSRRLWPLAALATVALVGAGCSNGSAQDRNTGTASSSGTASSTGTASGGADKKLSARDKAVKFTECIRAHGVSDFPDPNAENQFEYGVSVTLRCGSGPPPLARTCSHRARCPQSGP
jgi:hypothetical protein